MGTAVFDPFSTNPTSITNFTLTLTGDRFGGGAKTSQFDFYFTAPLNPPVGYSSIEILDGSTDVFYPVVGPPPTLSVPSPATGTIGGDFTGVPHNQTLVFPLTLDIPAGADFTASTVIPFDIIYICKGTGGSSDLLTPTRLSGVFTFDVVVLSGLQANFAGPAMDFGDVHTAGAGNFTTFHAPTSGLGVVDVKSSGPFTVGVASANNYHMTNGGGGAANQIAYSLNFLNETVNSSTPFTQVGCSRAGVTAFEGLKMQATLAEATSGVKTVASYLDTLTVTVTPWFDLADAPGAPSAQACSSLAPGP